MATELAVEGKNFIPASDAGRSVGYTSDYIAKLARDGKLEATRIGRQWYVTLDSVLDFKSRTEEEKKIRGAEIRRERLEEQERYRRQTGVLIPSREYVSEVPDTRLVALAETLLILVIGLTLGMSGHFMLQSSEVHSAAASNVELNPFERLAIFLYELVMPEREVEINEATTSETVLPVSENNETLAEDPRSMIVAPESDFTVSDVASVQESFSDPVTVMPDAETPGTGLIVPHFKNGDGESYRYLMVPVQDNSGG